MRIVKRIDFAKLPPDTLFSEYEPCIFGPLMIKGETINDGADWFEQQIADAVSCDDSGEFGEILLRAQETGKSFGMDFDYEGRNGSFEPDDRLYAVWEPEDVRHLINRLQRCLEPHLYVWGDQTIEIGDTVYTLSPPTKPDT
jgi:hypothetical protein